MDYSRLIESLTVFAELARPSAEAVTLTLQIGSDPRDALSFPLDTELANDLDWALLRALARARCEDCGQISPADDPLDPVSGYLCPGCED
jgi:hypothetical protein